MGHSIADDAVGHMEKSILQKCDPIFPWMIAFWHSQIKELHSPKMENQRISLFTTKQFQLGYWPFIFRENSMLTRGP